MVLLHHAGVGGLVQIDIPHLALALDVLLRVLQSCDHLVDLQPVAPDYDGNHDYIVRLDEYIVAVLLAGLELVLGQAHEHESGQEDDEDGQVDLVAPALPQFPL